MATRVVRRTPRSSHAAKLQQYIALGTETTAIKKRRDQIRDELLEVIQSDHAVDEEKGHKIHTLPEPIDVSGKSFIGFMHQKKVSQVFLEDKAEELCKEKGFDLDDYTIRVVDQDKIVRLYADDLISEDEFNSLMENVESWAFVPVKE